jgi:hypothetical protein
MGLSYSLQMELVQGLEITGGLTSQTVFPKTEGKLLTRSDYQQALEYVGCGENMSDYWSMIDFLFCETFPVPWRYKAFAYYDGDGSQLIDDPDITDESLKRYDTVLCDVVLELCLWALRGDLWFSWERLRRAVEAAMATLNSSSG